MMLASEDPLNFILASVWTCWNLFCLWLTWYAYVLWKRNPDASISHRVAVEAKRLPVPVVWAIGVVTGITIGITIGMFSGHFFWPVELTTQ